MLFFSLTHRQDLSTLGEKTPWEYVPGLLNGERNTSPFGFNLLNKALGISAQCNLGMTRQTPKKEKLFAFLA